MRLYPCPSKKCAGFLLYLQNALQHIHTYTNSSTYCGSVGMGLLLAIMGIIFWIGLITVTVLIIIQWRKDTLK